MNNSTFITLKDIFLIIIFLLPCFFSIFFEIKAKASIYNEETKSARSSKGFCSNETHFKEVVI